MEQRGLLKKNKKQKTKNKKQKNKKKVDGRKLIFLTRLI